MNTEITIEKLRGSHLDGICKTEQLCFSEPWSRKSLEELLSCPYAVYFAAQTRDGEAVGYGGMYVLADTGSINNIGVLPEYRRMGIASRLLEALIGYARENRLCSMELEVRASNSAAIALYEKYGFTKVAERKNFYKKPTENALLYNLLINQAEKSLPQA